MRETVRRLESELVSGGGIHRYVNDNYFGGGEWVLLTAYLGCYHIEAGNLERARELRAWIEGTANAAGELPEQVQEHLLIPEMLPVWIDRWGPPAQPLVWSHAAYITLVSALNAAP
jgi:GH15 family glucan-1,4-alpha-glucosidase